MRSMAIIGRARFAWLVVVACSVMGLAPDGFCGGGDMDAFKLSQVMEERRKSGDSWLEFLRVPALSVGIYALPAGADDPQEPHTEDEVYYVVSGRASLRVGNVDKTVEPGAILFVGANVKHRFHTIKEDLTTLVFFAPAEGSRARSTGK